MGSRQNYWVQLLPLLPEDRQRFMSVQAEVVRLQNFRGMNKKIGKKAENGKTCF